MDMLVGGFNILIFLIYDWVVGEGEMSYNGAVAECLIRNS